MTIVMSRAHAGSPRTEAYPLSPRELTDRTFGGADAGGNLVAVLVHSAHGGTMEALNGLLPRRVSSVVYGIIVWVAIYLGRVPFAPRLRLADCFRDRPCHGLRFEERGDVLADSAIEAVEKRLSPLEREER